MRVNKWMPISFYDASKVKQEAYLQGIEQAFGVIRASIPMKERKGLIEPEPRYREFYNAIESEIKRVNKMIGEYK